MSKIEVNTVEPQCGTTLTLGASGDTITFPSGTTVVNNGSQTGFGRTGTVDWDTTAKTASFTAVSGNGYFVNTTSGAITVTLPAGSAGSIVSLKDYANTWNTNNVTLTPNGTDKINGTNTNAILNTQDQSVTLVYVDSTKGWRAVQDSTSDVTGISFITATGGTITTCGDYKIHTFTSPGTFCVSSTSTCSPYNTVGYMVVAGGGGGGYCAGGGGGAGGFREGRNVPVDNFTASPLVANAPTNAVTVTATSYPITVGAGGVGAPGPGSGANPGSNSIFSTITSTGGGQAGSRGPSSNFGSPGGSGGANSADTPACTSGTGNTPPVSPPQGQPGGALVNPSHNEGGIGGGGATQAGENSQSPFTPGVQAPDGGDGATTSISGSSTSYSGGGGGGGYTNCGCATSGAGGTGGGGAGANKTPSSSSGNPGTANTGGGGGGGGNGGSCRSPGGNGGSGVVIIRYKYQ